MFYGISKWIQEEPDGIPEKNIMSITEDFTQEILR